VRLNGDLVAVKAGKDVRARMGDVVGVAFDPAALHLFDGASGERLPDRTGEAGKVTPFPQARGDRHP
jgi:hypothetical protein